MSSARPRGFSLTAIGHVTTGFEDAASTPIQAQRERPNEAEFTSTSRIGPASTAWTASTTLLLITYLDRGNRHEPSPDGWKVVPFLLGDTGHEVGTFATSHPSRPNPIGLSLVRVIATRHDGFEFAGVDLVDQTPLLDIKPWVPDFDTPQMPSAVLRTGWYQPAVLAQAGMTPTELLRAPIHSTDRKRGQPVKPR